MASPPHHKRWRWRSCRTTTLIPFLLISTIIIAFWILMGESAPPDVPAQESYLAYSTVPGFFAQDDPATDDKSFDFMTSDFGLLSRSYDTDHTLPANVSTSQWSRFAHKLAALDSDAPATTTFRLLFLGRHGQGNHNVAEAFFGTAAWDCFYSTLNGSTNVTWSDAHLTPVGIRQAEDVSAFWVSQTGKGTPTPQTFYSSPLDRAIHTAQITFGGLDLPEDRRFTPIIKEMLREGIGIHTCDRRSSLSDLKSKYPSFDIEASFAEDDPLWLPNLREPGSAQTLRLRGLLDDIFAHDSSTWISMTSHGGTIQSILRAVGHREFAVQTGGVIPLLVKVERVAEKRPTEKAEPWGLKPECEDGEPGEEQVQEALRRFDDSMRNMTL